MKYVPQIRAFVTGSLAVLIIAPSCSNDAREQELPNVIYVFPDQFRNCALSFWNQEGYADKVNFRADPTHTPVLNSFARESVVLTSAISNFPLSSPHRGMLLTGMYPDRSGITLNCNTNRPFSTLSKDAETISDVFQQSGYDCGYIGKLHANTPTPNDPDRPGNYVEDNSPVWDAYTAPEDRHGFSYWYSYGTYDVHKRPHYWDTQGKRHEVNEWSPKHEADKAIDYIANVGNVRDSKKPFFLMVSMNPPHNPYVSLNDCMEEDYNLYKDLPIDCLLVRPNADRKMDKAKKSAAFYFASVTGVDREFGRILNALKAQGLDKNTIVIFASDHGETMCSQGTDDPKNSPYKESINIPFIIRYPDKLRPRVDDLLLSSPDIMPTILGLSGLGDKIPQAVEGNNYASLFLDEKPTVNRPDKALYIQNIDGEKDINGKVLNYFPSARGIKTKDHTLAIYINKEDRQIRRVLLYDDKNDPYQLNNLDITKNRELLNHLYLEMGKLLKETNDAWYAENILPEIFTYN